MVLFDLFLDHLQRVHGLRSFDCSAVDGAAGHLAVRLGLVAGWQECVTGPACGTMSRQVFAKHRHVAGELLPLISLLVFSRTLNLWVLHLVAFPERHATSAGQTGVLLVTDFFRATVKCSLEDVTLENFGLFLFPFFSGHLYHLAQFLTQIALSKHLLLLAFAAEVQGLLAGAFGLLLGEVKDAWLRGRARRS